MGSLQPTDVEANKLLLSIVEKCCDLKEFGRRVDRAMVAAVAEI